MSILLLEEQELKFRNILTGSFLSAGSLFSYHSVHYPLFYKGVDNALPTLL